jgi:hypothetical protein
MLEDTVEDVETRRMFDPIKGGLGVLEVLSRRVEEDDPEDEERMRSDGGVGEGSAGTAK